MSFEDTTRKMADDVVVIARAISVECESANKRPWPMGEGKVLQQIGELAFAVEKLALCVGRRFSGNADETVPTPKAKRPVPPPRASGEPCRDCGGVTVQTGACSTCTTCGTTGGCG